MAAQSEIREDHASPSASRFLKLPAEIRDQIYSYAFGTEFAVSNIISKEKWRAREVETRDEMRREYERELRSQRRAQLSEDEDVYEVCAKGPLFAPHQTKHCAQIRPVPTNPLQSMIVSKQFFHEAVDTWFRTTILEFPDHDAFDRFIQNMDKTPIAGIVSVRFTWECNNYTNSIFTPNIRWCTGLRRLQITVKNGLEVLEDKYDWLDKLEDEDFKDLQIVRNISAMTSIRHLKILPGKHHRVFNKKDADLYKRNLQALQAYVEKRSSSQTGGVEFSAKVLQQVTERIEYYSIRDVKEMASVYAMHQPEKAAAMVHCAMARANSAESAKGPNSEASSDDLDSKPDDEDTIMTDETFEMGSDDTIRQVPLSPPRGRAPHDAVSGGRITKPAPRQRSNSSRNRNWSKLSKRDVAIGGVLLANTICSVLALYYATRR